MIDTDIKYMNVLENVMSTGVKKGDRTGTGTISKFGEMARFDLRDGQIPMITMRQVFHRSFVHETLWFLSGETDIEYLKKHNVSIWDSWVRPDTARYGEMEDSNIIKAIAKYITTNTPVEEVQFEFVSSNPDHRCEVLFNDNKKVIYTYGGHNSLVGLYEELYGCAPVKLIGGSIGTGAYGSQWRAWDDTRVVPASQMQGFNNRGYTTVGKLSEDQVVVTRKIDQIANAIDAIKHNPDSRRIIVVAFNPSKVEDCVLPPCHSFFQFWTRELTFEERHDIALKTKVVDDEFISNFTDIQVGIVEGSKEFEELNKFFDDNNIPQRALSCMLYQRSCDFPVGGVFNIAQYGLLTHMIAQVTNTVAEEFVWVGGDVHVYANQLEGVDNLRQRNGTDKVPVVKLNPEIKQIDDFRFEDIEILNYEHDGDIKFPVAI